MAKSNKPVVKDRKATEQYLLKTVEEMVTETGFGALGINAVAKRAGMSKNLIYRYFGSVDEMVARFIITKDYWTNIEITKAAEGQTEIDYLKSVLHGYIKQLRGDTLLRQILRWELSSKNEITDRVHEVREQWGLRLTGAISRVAGKSFDEAAGYATLFNAAVSYLLLVADNCDTTYIGFDISTDEGWEKLTKTFDLMIDVWLAGDKRITG